MIRRITPDHLQIVLTKDVSVHVTRERIFGSHRFGRCYSVFIRNQQPAELAIIIDRRQAKSLVEQAVRY